MNNLSQQVLSKVTRPLEGTVLPAFAQRIISITQHARAIIRETVLKEQLKIKDCEIHAASHKREEILKEKLKQKEAIIRDLGTCTK